MKRTVTVIGGGTGSFHILSGLRRQPELEIRSIVTMMDSGGDSGRLRDEFGLLPPGDVDALAAAIIRLAKDRELSVRMGEKGYEFVKENYDWERSLDMMAETYHRLINEKK